MKVLALSLADTLIEKFKESSLPICFLIFVLIAWELLIPVFHIPSYLIPPPSAIFRTLASPRFSWEKHILTTLFEILTGFAFAVGIGILLAVSITSWKSLGKTIYPYIVLLKMLPTIAIAPLLILWLGYGEISKIMIAFLISFFPVVINTAGGLTSASPEVINVIRALNASRWQMLTKVLFPTALPSIFGGLKISVTLAVIGAVVAEFVASDRGLGYLLLLAGMYADGPMAFAALFLLSIIGAVLYVAICLLERIMLPWYIVPRKTRSAGA